MKRTMLALAATTALLSVAAGPARATLPDAATLKDVHDDVDKFKSTMGVAVISHPYDVYKIRGATDDGNLVLTIKLDDLTSKNTAVYQRPDGWWTYRGNFQAQLFVNGKWRWSVNRDFEPGAAILQRMVKGKYGIEHGPEVDCDPEAEASPLDASMVIDTVKDKVVYTVPLDCIGASPGDVFRFAAQVNTGDRDPYSFYDATGKTPEFTF